MERKQIENLYKANDMPDFQLKKPEDLLKVHGIDYREVSGYGRLDDLNKHLYEKFIVNFFNACGLELRAQYVPKGIYYVEEVEELVKDPQDDFYTVVGSHVYAIDKNGMKSVLHSDRSENYKDSDVVLEPPKNYLRFEYKLRGQDTWQHVISETEWY